VRPGRGARGASRVGCLLTLLILIVGGYAGVLVLGGEIDYQQLRTEAQRQAGLAGEMDDDAIRMSIATRARSLRMPDSAARPAIRRFPQRRIQIIIQYAEPIDFFGKWQWVRDRRIQIDQTY
jgi:hypothetical protein